MAPGMPVSATSCCRNFPALFAPSGPARTTRHVPVARPSLTLRATFGVQIGDPADLVAHPRAQTCAPCSRLALRCNSLHPCSSPFASLRAACGVQIGSPCRFIQRHATAWGKALLRCRPSWPPSKRDQTICFVRHARRKRAQRGPSNTANRRRTSPKDGPQDAGQFAAGTGTYLRRTPSARSEPAAHGWAKGVFAGWPFSW
jgi:hypothetical protein